MASMGYGKKMKKKMPKNMKRAAGMNKHPKGPGPMCNGGNGRMC